MSADCYLEEAATLACLLPRNRCPSTDALDILDTHPTLRLPLEDTWTDAVGRVYREVTAERLSRWPYPIARSFRAFLRIGKEPGRVIELLDLLHELDANTQVVRRTLKGCHKRQSLDPAIQYFTSLTEELRAVTSYQDRTIEVQALQEPTYHPRYACGEVTEGTWVLHGKEPDPGEEFYPPTHKPALIHNPQSTSSWLEQDWIHNQPWEWKRLYFRIQKAKHQDLKELKECLLEAPDEIWSKDQLTILWETYRTRRDFLRRSQERKAGHSLGGTASKLLNRISRIKDRSELGFIGKCLYRSMKGEIDLPGPVSQPEWAIVFRSYRDRKEAMSAAMTR